MIDERDSQIAYRRQSVGTDGSAVNVGDQNPELEFGQCPVLLIFTIL